MVEQVIVVHNSHVLFKGDVYIKW